jgi:hypothetical protein
MDHDSLHPDATGAAHLDGVGPITLEQVKEFFGTGAHLTVAPVIDLADQRPVNRYTPPDKLREAVHLRTPGDVFPFAVNRGRTMDLDHLHPYADPDHGGPPGQTRLDNLAPMTRFHHRIKTHSRWRLRTPAPGIQLWRSPHGWYYQTDHTGTTSLTKHAGQALWDTCAHAQTAPSSPATTPGHAPPRSRTPLDIDVILGAQPLECTFEHLLNGASAS